ncbi:MAG: hypothetical protein HY329_14730, partial [Chloroflexi bacterium]|nr:hypothetical protein [Chloroflexota bacterium]
MARTHWLLRVILVLGLISTLGTSVVFADPGAPLSPDDSAGVYQPTDDLDALTRGGGGRDRDRDRDDDEDNRGRGRARITWSVRKVEECLGPGESLSKTVSFTSNRAMQNVELDVRPDSSVVDFSPSSFASVAANASNSVTLSLKLPSSTHRSQYVSLIHLTSGHRNLGRPLQVKIKVKQADGTCQRGDDDDDDDDNNNNQHLPRLSVNDVNVTEGNGGTTNATFTVSASSAPTQTITVNYATVNGTATGGASCTTGVDYVTSTGTVTLNAGETSKTFTVQVCGDTTGEANETFFVDLSAPVNASLGDDDGKATILDDDGGQGTQSSLSINDVTVTEGNSGTTNATFTVSLAASSTQVVTVSFATANGSTDPATGGASCTTGVDYVTSTGTVTLNAGETSKTFTVQV